MPVHQSQPDIAHFSETDSTDDSDDDGAPNLNVSAALPAAVAFVQAAAPEREERNDTDCSMSDDSEEEEIPLQLLRERAFTSASDRRGCRPGCDHKREYPWQLWTGCERDVDADDDLEDGEGHLQQTISELDAATEELSNCDLCLCSLGPRAEDVDTRAFRCCKCVLSVQCETCCAQTHLQSGDHFLQEWDNVAREWGPEVSLAETLSTMAKICAACEIEVAAHGAMLADGTFMCTDCGPKLYCGSCCIKEHKRRPLHRVKIWEGGWKATTLAEEGLIHHLGHQGQRCLWPLQPPVEMMVMCNGPQTITVQFCGCGNFESGPAGEWTQIRVNGWFRAGLVHPRVCAAFRVMSDRQESAYERNELKEGWDDLEL
ncbi:hypothetical protein DFH06DRAFT_1351788 [Mycena polygramma]|nr:hypothetical protein DFH06DRAFT_1351788 [Mycena polygramma]